MIFYLFNEKKIKQVKDISQKTKEELKEDMLNMKFTELIREMLKDDSVYVDTLEKGTDAYDVWIETLEDLDVNSVLDASSFVSNIKALKDYSKKQEENESDLLSDPVIQDMLCDVTRSFLRNIKQEFGNILIAFAARLIELLKTIGIKNPSRGVEEEVQRNSRLICSAIIKAISEFTPDKPSVFGVKISKKAKKGRKSKFGVNEKLLVELKSIFDEEVLINPEDAIILDDNNQAIVNVAEAINVSDLITITKSRDVKTNDGSYSIYSAFRMYEGGYKSNFVFGIQIVPDEHNADSFNLQFYLYFTDGVSKPSGILPCQVWI